MRVKKLFISLIIIILFNLIYITFANASSFPQVDVETVKASLSINAPSALLIEKASGDILYQKEAFTPMYPASTVKIMTAIIALENCSLDEPITVSESAILTVPSGYTVSKIQAGEILSTRDLLYALLVPSGNDAANALAEHIAGNIPAFVNMMNEKAKHLGCQNTYFTNPNGVHDANMHTTAYDLALMAKYAMNLEEFRTIVSTETYTLPSSNVYPLNDRVLHNSNHLINTASPHFYEYATGIKTGYTNPAQNCLVASAKKDNIEFIAVILGSTFPNTGDQAKFVDAKNLFEFGFTYHYSYYKEKSQAKQAGIWSGIINTELMVDENNKPRWGYVLYLIARTTLILIAIIYILYHLITKTKRYIYNRTHAKYDFKY